MMTDCSTGRKLFVTMMRSWTSSGSTRSHGLTSKICEAQRTFSHQHDSDLPYNKRNTPSCGPSRITGLHLPRLNQPGRCYSSAAGSLWDDQPRTRPMLTVPASWRTGPLLVRRLACSMGSSSGRMRFCLPQGRHACSSRREGASASSSTKRSTGPSHPRTSSRRLRASTQWTQTRPSH